VAVVIHGGCWVSIATNDYMDRLAGAVTEAGWATWNLEFRRIDRPGGSWPGIFHDVARGTDFLREIADRYELDLDRVVSIGHSSGGHLALWVAGRHRIPPGTELHHPDPLPLRGAISLGGVADLKTFHEMEDRACGADRIPELVGGTPGQVPARYAQASPAELLPMGVPQLLLTGDSDASVPVAHAAEYELTARGRGDEVVLHTIRNAAHFEVVAPWSERWPDVARPLFAFLTGIAERSGG
jgi:acetyl esterase/lipase